ncbi:MAG TPA: Stp1/IreP family PP2C-type Ser/Thr phosphatase, partial [Chloroflexi bacterium]|nr:Stp1/IreP family PP2C-type Ser/Thr phosphatase [Chloroflexota bacterium]
MSPSKLTVEVWPVTDRGQALEQNEDFVLVYQPTDPQQARYSGSLYVVVDGMGGGMAGQLASRYAARKVMHAYYSSDEPDLGLRLREAVEAANADLYQYAQSQPELVKLSTTLVAAAIRGEEMHIAAVGDSRAYLIREGQIQQITRDHTLVQQLLDEGAITPEQAREHPRRDVVLRALGMEETVAVDVFDLRLRPDDAVILCTDGLTEYLHEDEIARIVASSSPRSAAETLIQKANDRGGKDNVTVVAALARDGAPPLVTDIPHRWDGQPPTFDEQPTLAVPRTERPLPPTEAMPVATGGEETPPEPPPAPETPPAAPPAHLEETAQMRRPQPQPPVEPAPPHRWEEAPAPSQGTPVQPAPPYGTPPQQPPQQPPPQPGYPAQPPPGYGQPAPPPPGYAIDPATGLPPVPPGGQPGYGVPRQAGPYAPRVYQPPAQPNIAPRRGIPIGWFFVAGIVAIVLTALMVVVLVNPMNWELKLPSFAGGAATEAPTQAAEAPPTQPVDQPTAVPPTPVPATPEPTQPVAPPGMVLIEGGPFLRGVSDEEVQAAILSCINEAEDNTRCLPEYFTDAQPVEEVTLSPFFIDVTEVTNVDYAACVAAEVCSPPQDEQYYADPAFAQHPVVFVTWQQAVEYCTWAGRRLPTEAEWEKAARWDPVTGESYVYPWGNEWEPGRANTAAAGLGGTSAVQAFAQDISPTGVLDMTGNVSEWIQDWYFPGYENQGTLNPTGPETQPLGEPFRVVRGGSFLEDLSSYVRAGHRLAVNPEEASSWIGFRCAMDVAGAEPVAVPTGEAPAAGTPAGEG